MPEVRRYERRQVQSAPLPGARVGGGASPQAFGSGVGRGVSNIGDAAARIYLDEQRKAEQIDYTKNDAQFGKFVIDQQIKFSQLRGEDAFAQADTVMAEAEAYYSKLRSQITSERVKEAMDRSWQQRMEHLYGFVQKHVARERQAYDQAWFEAHVQNERESAALNFNDPDSVRLSIDRQRAALIDYADRNGMPSEWVKARTHEIVGQTHAAVIGRMIGANDYQGAKAYFEENRSDLLADDADRIQRAVEDAGLRGESQQRSDAIILDAKDRQAALEQAREITDPELRDAVVGRVNAHFSQKQQAEAEQREQVMIDAGNLLDQSHGNMDVVRRRLVEQWQTLTPGQRSALEARADQIRRGVDPETDLELFYDLRSLASTQQTLPKFLQTNLLEHRHKLSNSDFKSLTELQSQLRSRVQANGSTDDLLHGIRTRKSVVDGALRELDISDKDDPKRANAFRRSVDEQVVLIQKQEGREATPDEVQQITDRLTMEVVADRGWVYNSRSFIFELTPDQVDVDDIPAGERAQIESALKSRGTPVTDAAIVNLYVRKLQLRGPDAAE